MITCHTCCKTEGLGLSCQDFAVAPAAASGAARGARAGVADGWHMVWMGLAIGYSQRWKVSQ